VTLIIPIDPPADAGAISGPASVIDGQSIELEIAEIERAATYKWYKDGAEVQNSESRILTVTAGGDYTVAGVNESGEGARSEAHSVTLLVLPGAAPPIEGGNEIAGAEIQLYITPTIENADTYRWYKDGVEIKNTAARWVMTTGPGTYKVAGVNAVGEGTPSPDHVVTKKVMPPAAPSSVTINGKVYRNNDNYSGAAPVEATVSAVDGATSYKWVRSSFPDSMTIQEGPSLTCTLTQSGTIVVTAINEAGESPGLTIYWW
jgi:hypothetical protein